MTLIGLEYLKHQEAVRANRAREAQAQAELTHAYHNTDTIARTAAANRASNERIALLDRESREYISDSSLDNAYRIAAYNRTSNENIARIKAESDFKVTKYKERMNSKLQAQRLNVDIEKFNRTYLQDQLDSNRQHQRFIIGEANKLRIVGTQVAGNFASNLMSTALRGLYGAAQSTAGTVVPIDGQLTMW